MSKKVKSKIVKNQVFLDTSWKCDLPAFLKEIASNPGNPYGVTFNILKGILTALTERAIELNDPALNIIMLQLSLYEGSHENLSQKIEMLRKQIKI